MRELALLSLKGASTSVFSGSDSRVTVHPNVGISMDIHVCEAGGLGQNPFRQVCFNCVCYGIHGLNAAALLLNQLITSFGQTLNLFPIQLANCAQ